MEVKFWNEILLGPFLNTLTHLFKNLEKFYMLWRSTWKNPVTFYPFLNDKHQIKFLEQIKAETGKRSEGILFFWKIKKKLTVLLSFESLLSYKISEKSIEHI